MKKLKLAALATTLLMGVGAHADQAQPTNWYGEVGYLGLKNSPNSGDSVTPKLARVTVGKNFDETWAAEAMLGVTASKAKVVAIVAPPVTGEISNTFFGVYAKPKYALTPDITLFARGGFAHTSLTEAFSDGRASESVSSTKLSYGFGAEMNINANWYGALDYMEYGKYSQDNSNVKYNGLTLSVGYKF